MAEATPTYTLRQLIQYFLYLGYAGFGGPVALVGYMHRDLVEERKWISEEEYKDVWHWHNWRRLH
jgi:chromate transporter